ncbi:hypothetical protein O6H91_03G037700 [Diphasiastrum complanatum]|uniref:Uncharacterized protein n=1 Tax=Diphasiastrum complanatum TaxID=34168 RepID=A0ACC2E5A6_DIPCM|nr:hypothetical protein O6H91_03G037700 [Diphasiastrum complanatum]
MDQIQSLFIQSGGGLMPKGFIEWEMRGSRELLNFDAESVGYTSLRDVLSSLVVNHKQGAIHRELVCFINPRTPIKNHLVEKAARAYLQPLTVVEKRNKSHFFVKYWQKFVCHSQISFSFKDFFWGSFDAISAFISKVHLLDLSQALQYILALLRPKNLGLLQL